MDSEALDYTRIFFKDRKNELQGPYTERKVQEGYRMGWFENSCPFYFAENDSVSDDSPSFTLGELCAHNGIGAPFSVPSESSSIVEIRAEFEKKLGCLEEEIRSLRVKLEAVLRMKERIEKIEETIKSLPTQSALLNTVETVPDSSNGKSKKGKNKKNKKVNSDVNSVKQRDKQRKAELCEFNKWTDFYSDFYMDYLVALRTSSYVKINRGYKEATSFANLIMKHEEARLMCIEKMIEKIKRGRMIICHLCECFFFNYRHWFLHCIDPVHIQNEKSVPNTLRSRISDTFLKMTEDIRAKLKADDEVFVTTLAKKYASVRLENPSLRPTQGFLAYQDMCYSPLFEIAYDSTHMYTSEPEKMVATFSKWKDDGTADRVMAGIHDHIGTALTCCHACGVVTGTRDEYYRHVLLVSHLKMVSLKVNDLHLGPTYAINLTKKHLIE